MSNLPAEYRWLADEPGPHMIVEALKLFGTLEKSGAADNPVILGWATEIGVRDTYSHDEIPWCGLFMGVVAKRAGKVLPAHPLWALDWKSFGRPVDTPMLGDVLVFTRNGGGHVTLYVGEDDNAYHCLGGNQHDSVCISRIAKARKPVFRRPNYSVEPPNVRAIHLAANGATSSAEA
jgi:uncharacterized protein (TIGR02594 family)